jgi:hypothetical protein
MGGGPTFSGYQSDRFDEMFDDLGRPREDCQSLFQRIRNTLSDDLIRCRRAPELGDANQDKQHLHPWGGSVHTPRPSARTI